VKHILGLLQTTMHTMDRKKTPSPEHTIPKRNTITSAARIDNPAPDRDASVRSLGIFLCTNKTLQSLSISCMRKHMLNFMSQTHYPSEKVPKGGGKNTGHQKAIKEKQSQANHNAPCNACLSSKTQKILQFHIDHSLHSCPSTNHPLIL
jgi:hypothetical protein